MRRSAVAASCWMLAACTGASDVPAADIPPATPPADAIRVLDPAALDRLKGNAGVTLQWIGWNQRGSAFVREEGGAVRLTASQAEAGGPGRLLLDGRVAEIGSDYFIFSGRIAITGTPDPSRRCVAERGDWRFAVTQNRPYWRLRQFEWCDGLTDYIDIYLPGTRP